MRERHVGWIVLLASGRLWLVLRPHLLVLGVSVGRGHLRLGIIYSVGLRPMSELVLVSAAGVEIELRNDRWHPLTLRPRLRSRLLRRERWGFQGSAGQRASFRLRFRFGVLNLLVSIVGGILRILHFNRANVLEKM